MSCLGVHLALTEQDVATLLAIGNEQARLSYLQEELEELYLAEPMSYAAESDKSWDPCTARCPMDDSPGEEGHFL